MERGSSFCQPSLITWSWRNRGTVQRIHMKTKIVASTLPKRIAIEASPATSGWSQSAHPVRWCRPPRSRASEIPGKRFHPPRKRSANTADPTIMLAYSATKNRDHLKAPYSVWNPPTRSASDSGMSKGWRFVSANRATAKTRAETGMVNRNHAPPQNPGRLWNSTTRARLSVPAVPGSLTQRNTGSTQDPNFGFNASTEQYEDLVKAGVIDPTKVTRTALQNAASIASLMLTTEAMICGIVEEVGS